MNQYHDYVSTPIGRLLLLSADGYLRRIAFETEDQEFFIKDSTLDTKSLQDVKTQIIEYFEGKRHAFDIPVFQESRTSFRKNVLAIISHIPYGQTISYGDIVNELGMKGGGQAVGTACGKNQIPIIIPCHRVIKNDGSYGEYLGGKKVKEYLLNLER